MRRLCFVIIFSLLLLTVGVGRRGVVSDVRASVEVYQGDLVLGGNNVTIIEGYFGINGSVYVEGNATLILTNAVVNFTKAGEIHMRYPANGNPRFQVENTEFVGAGCEGRFSGNSSATFSNATGDAYFYFSEETSGSIVDSALVGLQARGSAAIAVLNSSLQYVDVVLADGEASVVNLSPGFFDLWDFQEDCSVVSTPKTAAPDVVFSGTEVGFWSFSFQNNSTASVAQCELLQLHTNEHSTVDVYDSVIDTVELYHSATVTLTNTTCGLLRPFGEGGVWVYWYLDVHVLDSSPFPGQSVGSANVSAVFSNGTLAGKALTGVDGWTRLTLMEKMANATGNYAVGSYTVNATYLSYSSGATVNMSGNQAVTLALLGFVVPEFPSVLLMMLMMVPLLSGTLFFRKKLLKREKLTPARFH